MDISEPTPQPEKRKRGRPPSKEEAAFAMNIIKETEKETDELEKIKEAESLEYEKRMHLAELEKAKIAQAQQLIKRRLRENLKKKEEQYKLKANTKFLEKSDGKIKWKSINFGNKLQGYVNDKLIFEIERKQITFNLYLKDNNFLKNKKLKNYIGCSTNLQKLKDKSEKLI